MQALTKRDEKVVRALAQTLLTRGGPVRHDAVDAGVVERIDAWMATLNRVEILKMRGLFHMFDLWYAAHAFNPLARFVDASREQRAAYLATWEHSDTYARRLAFQGIRQIISIAYMEHSGVRRAMGIDEDISPEDHLRRLAEAVDLLRDRPSMKRVG